MKATPNTRKPSWYRYDHWILLGIMLLGVLLRLYRLGFKPFWQDEGATWYIARGILRADASPYLYYRLLNITLQIFGHDEFAGRLLSVFAGVLFIFAIYLFVRTIFDAKTATLVALLAAVSPYAITLSQEMRMYALVGLETALLLFFFWRIRLPGDREYQQLGWWIGLLLVAVAGIYTHIIMAFQLVFLTFVYLFDNLRRSPSRLIYWGVLLLLVGLVYFPQWQAFSGVYTPRKHVLIQPVFRAFQLNLSLLSKSLITFLSADLFELMNRQMSKLPLAILLKISAVVLSSLFIGAWMVIAYVKKGRTSNSKVQRVGVKFLVFMLVCNLVLFMVLEVSSPNHMITLFVPCLVLTGFFIRQSKQRLAVLALLAFLFISSFALVDHYRKDHSASDLVRWNDVAAYLEQRVEPADVILVFEGRNIFYALKYYCNSLACDMRYTHTNKYVEDPYQIEPRYAYPIPPDRVVSAYLERYKRIWCLGYRHNIETIILTANLPVQKTDTIGSLIDVILLEIDG